MTQFSMKASVLASVDDINDSLPLIRGRLEEDYNSENSIYYDKFIDKTYYLEKVLRGLRNQVDQIDTMTYPGNRSLIHDIAKIGSYVEFMEETLDHIIVQKD